MSLDQNLFTLVVTPHPENPNVIDLVDQVKGATIYRKQRVPGPSYSMEFYDFNSESLLATATAPSQSSKTKTIELQNPTVPVELKYTGTLSFKWGFKWEDHDFEWRREECYMLRKPDPAVLVAITKEPSGKLKTSVIQLLDYNLNRFDIDDRKGLEVVMLTALMTLNDSNQDYHEGGSGLSLPRRKSATAAAARPAVLSDSPPPPVPSKPPLPAAKTGIDRIAELQALRSEPNEVNVEDEGTVDAYAEYCYNLLLDDAMLFITVSSVEASHVPKVLQVVEATKRLRYKNGEDEEPLHQYVLYDQQKKKGPKRINLDTQKGSKAYEPPSSLSVHLSKIEMDELKPKVSIPTTPLASPLTPGPSSSNIFREESKKNKGKEKSDREKRKERERWEREEKERMEREKKKGRAEPKLSKSHPPHPPPYQTQPLPPQLRNPVANATSPSRTSRPISQFFGF